MENDSAALDRHTIRALFHQGRYDEAVALAIPLAQIDQLAPHPFSALLDDAVAQDRRLEYLMLLDRIGQEEAQDCRLLDLRAIILQQIGRLDEAESTARRALIARPHHLPSINLLVSILTQAGRFEEAEAILRAQYQTLPDDPATIANLAVIMTAQNKFAEALQLYREAIAHAPTHARIRLNHSIALLKAGYYTQGWAEHEWRLDLPGHTSLPRETALPNLTPDLDLADRHVLLTQEEGLGDTLMYLRYVPLLAERGARVTIWGAETLADMMRRVPGVERVQVGGDTPDYDYHCPFISLPRAFAATSTPFGVDVPYLTVDPAKRAAWARRMQDDRLLRVGVVWAGAPRPTNPDAFMLDQRRSMPLSALAPLFRSRSATFYSLQKGPATEQLDITLPEYRRVVDWSDSLNTMDDTAALIANLDVVISVDTSVVHLAGALGKRVILMDRVNPCWRWLHDRTDSPWYPDLTIVRQSMPWQWSDVVQRVAALLRKERRK